MTYWKPTATLISVTLLLIAAALIINAIHPFGSAETPASMGTSPAPRFVNLGEFLINLNGEDGHPYLKTSISLKLGASGDQNKVEESIPEIRHHVNLALQNLTASELLTREGKSKLSEQIREYTENVMGYRGNDATPANSKSRIVSDVLFTSFVVKR